MKRERGVSCCIILALCHACAAFAQNDCIKGTVVDSESGEPIMGATVTLKDSEDDRIVTYCVTSGDGSFRLTLPKPIDSGTHFIQVSCLGYANCLLGCGEKDCLIRMVQKPFALKEVFVEADRIIQDKDTVSYFVSGFVTKKDRTIGDVLSNMPGINVADNGKISYNGKPINKFYIEGIDLLDGKYNLATDNISHENIARVDIWENHQPVKALRGSGLDTETAVNLKLKDGSRSVWTGYLSAGTGYSADEGLWECESFAAKFSSSSQSLISLKSNNSGKNIKDEGNTLTADDLRLDYAASEITGALKSRPSLSTVVDNDRTRLARTHLISSSNMWKLSEDSQIRAQLIFTDDRNRYSQSVWSSYYLADSTLVKGTEEEGSVTERQLQASVKLTVDRHPFYLSDEVAYSSDWNTFDSYVKGDFVNTGISSTDTHKVRNRLRFVKRFGSDILQVFSYNSFICIPERLNVLGETEKSQVLRKSSFFSDTRVKLVRSGRTWSFAANVDLFGSVYRLDSSYEDEEVSYLNDLTVTYVGGKVYPEIVYQSLALRISLEMPLSIYDFGGDLSDKKIYFRPELSAKWHFLPKCTAYVNLAGGSSYSGNSLYYANPIMTDYRSMDAGLVDAGFKSERRVSCRLSYADAAEMLFANLSLTSSVENTHRALTKSVSDGRVFYSYIKGDDIYRLWLADGSVTKGVAAIRGKIEFGASFYSHSLPIEQNEQKQDFDFQGLNADLKITSAVTDWMDLNYAVGYVRSSMSSEALESATRTVSQKLLLAVYPTDDLSFRFKVDHCLTFFDSGQSKSILLADVECVYRYKRLDLSASCTNLLNRKRYSYAVYEDLSSTVTGHDLRGLNVLAGITWHY